MSTKAKKEGYEPIGPGNTCTVEEVLEQYGIPPRLLFLYMTCGMALCADYAELEVTSLMSPLLLCEWKLTKEQEAIITSSFYVGAVLGALLWGRVSDRMGRRMSMLMILPIGAAAAFLCVLATDYVEFIIIRFASGLMLGGFHVFFTYASEWCTSGRRAKSAMLIYSFQFIGLALGGVLASLTLPEGGLGWRWYCVLSACPLLIVALQAALFFPESPRYLVLAGRNEEAHDALKQIFPDLPNDVRLIGDTESKRGNIKDVFHPLNTRGALTFLIVFLFMAAKLNGGAILAMFVETVQNPEATEYCGDRVLVPTNDGYKDDCNKLETTDYFYSIVINFSYVLSGLFGSACLDRIGRRKTLLVATPLGALLLATFLFCMPTWSLVIMSLIAKSLLLVVSFSLQVYTTEVYPTYIRGLAMGIVEMAGRVSYVIAPLITQNLGKMNFSLAISVLVAVQILASVNSWFVKHETKGLVQPDTDKSDELLHSND